MCKILFVILICTFTLISYGQTIDSVKTISALKCETASERNSNLYIKYCKSSQFDSAHIILDEWQNKCGLTEPIFRAKVLLLIKEHKFSETMFDSIAISYSIEYSFRIRTFNPSNNYFKNPAAYGFIPIGSRFDTYTSQLAREVITEYLIGSIERLYCLLYSNDINSFFGHLKSNTYSTSEIKKVYNNYLNDAYNLPSLHFSISYGVWIPTGHAALLGVHPVFGLQMGIKKGKADYNITIDVKSNKSRNSYTVIAKGRTFESDYFLSDYIGFNITREIYNSRNYSISLLGGIGLDEMDVLEENVNDTFTENDKGLTLNTTNYNFGLRYQRRLKTASYIGLETKYNIIHYDNKGGTNISGNAFTIDLIYGGFTNVKRKNLLKVLYY